MRESRVLRTGLPKSRTFLDQTPTFEAIEALKFARKPKMLQSDYLIQHARLHEIRERADYLYMSTGVHAEHD